MTDTRSGETVDPGLLCPLDPANMLEPEFMFRTLRERPGLFKVEGQRDIYVASRHDDISYVLTHDNGDPISREYLTDVTRGAAEAGDTKPSFSIYSGEGIHPEAAEILKGYVQTRALENVDPPLHTRHRALVSKVFTPRRVEELKPYIRDLAETLVSGWDTAEPVDFVSQFAQLIPMTVIADQLGVGRDRFEDFQRWSAAEVGALAGPVAYEDQPTHATAMVELQKFLGELVDERRSQPVQKTDDILGGLINAEVDGVASLSREEVIRICSTLLRGGMETTSNLMGSTMYRLLIDPELMSLVRRDPSRIPDVVEETLRVEPPVQSMFRETRRDIEIGGTLVPSGSLIMLLFGAANTDSSHFPDPKCLDPDRKNSRSHLTFGHGLHFCLGSNLARAEAAIGLEVVLQRTSNLTLAVAESELERLWAVVIRGFKALPVNATLA